MSSQHWAFHLDDKPWDGTRALYILRKGYHERAIVHFTMTVVEQGVHIDAPSLTERREDRDDNLGDVEGFLRGAMELAWSLGMRPAGFEDHANELKATRYHLEDMRKMAKVPGAVT